MLLYQLLLIEECCGSVVGMFTLSKKPIHNGNDVAHGVHLYCQA